MTVHEIQEDGTIKEIHQATGGPTGGQNINIKFRELLEKLFSKRVIQDYVREHPVDWLYLMNDFEVKKRGKRVSQGATTRIRLPNSFVSKFSIGMGRDINTFIQELYSLDEIKVQRNEYLCLEAQVMRELFDPVLNQIITHLSNLFAMENLSGVKYVFLVGGFAESALLQERVKRHFGHSYRIMVPQYASLAVVQGAVMFGQNPEVFHSRVMTASYGIRVHRLFLDGLHPESKKIIVNGIPRCKDIFFKFVKVDEVVTVGEVRRFPGFEPLTGDQKRIKIDFYQSEVAEAEFVTDDGVRKVSCQGLVLETPEAWKTRDIEINLSFGGTEIKVTVVNPTSNKQCTAYLDFLTKNE